MFTPSPPTSRSNKRLRAKLDVNGCPIDHIEIVRIQGEKHGPCRYRVTIGTGTWEVDHHYDDGAWVLIRKAVSSGPFSGDGDPDSGSSSLACPGCGGPTEFDRCVPPNPYYCEDCEAKGMDCEQ